jgi:hypothetical protein
MRHVLYVKLINVRTSYKVAIFPEHSLCRVVWARGYTGGRVSSSWACLGRGVCGCYLTVWLGMLSSSSAEDRELRLCSQLLAVYKASPCVCACVLCIIARVDHAYSQISHT